MVPSAVVMRIKTGGGSSLACSFTCFTLGMREEERGKGVLCGLDEERKRERSEKGHKDTRGDTNQSERNLQRHAPVLGRSSDVTLEWISRDNCFRALPFLGSGIRACVHSSTNPSILHHRHDCPRPEPARQVDVDPHHHRSHPRKVYLQLFSSSTLPAPRTTHVGAPRINLKNRARIHLETRR